jgi:hypothetical protein
MSYFNKDFTQSQYATTLGTTTDGTAWYTGGSYYPMAATFNYYLGATTYYALSNPTVEQLKSELQFDIYYGYPMAADVGELKGLDHLEGHPVTQEIWHWVAIDGYSNNGDYLEYVDPASKAPSLNWGQNVPPRTTMATTKFQSMAVHRGIIH